MQAPGRKLALALASGLAISAAGLASLSDHEGGNVRKVYLDVVNIPTACIGTTEGLTAADVGRVLSDGECEARNRKAVASAESAVRRGVKVPVTQAQYDAMVSFTYNVGNTAFTKSTFLGLLNAGQCRAAADQLLRWNMSGGRVVKGLSLRRERERATFIKDCP